MKLKNLFKVLGICFLLLLLSDAFARAGGGHGGGHATSHGGGSGHYGRNANNPHGGIINNIYELIIITLTLVTIVIGGTIPALLKLKSSFAANILTHASNKDTLWDSNHLKTHARRTFYKMQEAWQNRNIHFVKSLITPELYEMYKTMLEEMEERGEKNMLSRIDITETTIIGCEDFKDDSKDRYIAFIKGTMLDYVIHEPSKNILINPEKKIGTFSDTYHFVRINNHWILEKIDNTVTVLDIIGIKNYTENINLNEQSS